MNDHSKHTHIVLFVPNGTKFYEVMQSSQ